MMNIIQAFEQNSKINIATMKAVEIMENNNIQNFLTIGEADNEIVLYFTKELSKKKRNNIL